MRKVILPKQIPTDVVSLTYIDPRNKIYASRIDDRTYKLHEIGEWMFCALDNSTSGAHGIHSTAKDAIEAQLEHGVFEFDNMKEFLEWANT